MAKNFLDEPEGSPDLQELRFYILWKAIFYHHFPPDLDYGMAPQLSITGNGVPNFLVLRIAHGSEDVIVVIVLKKSANGTPDAMDNVVRELVAYIGERFTETGYPTIYGIAGIGPSWTALKMDKAGSRQLTTLVPWHDNVMSNESFLAFEAVADEIHAMTKQVWLPYFTVFWSLYDSPHGLYPHHLPTVLITCWQLPSH